MNTSHNSTKFWSNEPTVLFNKDSITQVWVNPTMNIEQKLNEISRLVIILSILGFIVTGGFRFLIIGFVTLAIIYIIYNIKKQSKEGFENDNLTKITSSDSLRKMMKTEFQETTKKNPMGNVLLTDINDTPDRKSAPPSFNVDVTNDINKSTKQAVQSLNPGIKNTTSQLYGDLCEEYKFDESMRQFYSMPNTKVTNDQSAFAEYLYGNMTSCKEGDPFTCIQDNLRYIQM